MKILIWNMNYWDNTNTCKKKHCDIISWKYKCIDFFKKEIKENNIDFFILQEINPIKLFERNLNNYFFPMTDYNILYQELTSELMYDGIRDNLWGNAIIYHKDYEIENENGLIDFSIKDSNYYGRNGLMCYEFSSTTNKSKKITIINYYNKKNYANKSGYKISDDIKNDIKKIIENKKEDIIIFTGDFNKGFRKDGINCIDESYDKFVELSMQELKLEYCIPNNKKGFIPTYRKNNELFLNDFCFTKNALDINLMNEKEEWEIWKKLSDHRPLIIEIKEK
jgi:hypothetical protein